MSGPEGRGAGWTRAEGAAVPPGLTSEGRARREGGASRASRKRKTAERGTSDEGRRRLKAPRRRAGGHSEPEGRGAAWTRAEGAPVPPGLTSEGRARREG